MSRIFDALQRSGTEQSGVEYPDMMSVAAAVFEAPLTEEASKPAVEPTPEQVREITMPIPVPEISIPDSVLPSEAIGAIASFPSLEVTVAAESRLVFFSQPESLATEKFRFLGVRLRQMRNSRPLKRVLVTSTIPEEGKSLVAVNLAGVLARRKEKVLLVEGDLRRPVLTHNFGLGTLAGLAEWLQNGIQTPSNIYHLGGPGFWIMPAGHPPSNPLELMQSGRLSALFRQITDLFDWVIVDSPPLLPLADTTIWSRLTDGTLLVTREGSTQKGSLQRGLEAIKKSDLLGVVLNCCTDTENDNYYRRYSPPTSK
ncbi:MAG TPA: CpsD/CapB family tyrosine-protein kinase [Candidatus Sulfotelmatobacter sp.]|nr:CpsD/CapB family tyrosine-protein kinase [Candidatus Sulfotelmatobacter sp.]